jgi:hypothetical protein
MASFKERRRTVRIAVNGNLAVENVPAGPSLRLVDVGIGGFCVQSPAPLPLDVVSTYRFSTPDKKWSAVFRARTAYCKAMPAEGKTALQYVTGLSFVNIEPEATQRQLMAMMDHAMAFVSFS